MTNAHPTRTNARPILLSGTEDGHSYLRAAFPADRNAESQTVDLSFLLRCPNLSQPFSYAFIGHFAPNRPATRHASAGYLEFGFITYLDHKQLLHSSLTDMTTTLFNDFIVWLDRVDPHKSTAVFAYSTRNAYCGAIRNIISWLQRNKVWCNSLPARLDLPASRWPGLTRHRRPTPILNDSQLVDIYRACMAEVKTIVERISDLPNLLASGIERLPQTPGTYRDYPDLAVCLAALDAYYPESIPNERDLYQNHSYLRTALRQYGGLLAVRRYLFPDVRGMVPFVLLLAIHTRYNPESLLTSNVDDYTIEQRLGQEVLVSRVYKWRSRRPQIVRTPVDTALDNPYSLLTLLLQWSERARRIARPEINRRLFLFLPTTGHASVMTYHSHPNAKTSVWPDSLSMFCADHKLAHFSLRQIRHTMIDFGTALYQGDILAAQALGDQRSPQTLFSHYTSDAQRQRNSERTGEIMSLRQRWRETRGLIDPRNQPSGVDEGAATPGWRCFDPYDSPFTMKDKLCDAYGMCPICPLAHVDFTSPYACAQLHNLLSSLRKARGWMAPQAFLARFGPVEEKLITWLRRFPQHIHDEAKHFEHLGPLPIPE